LLIEIQDYIGKDAAKKILEQKPNQYGNRILTGEGLKVGGEGMKTFYNEMLPKIVNKFGKKFGAKVEETEIDTGVKEDDGEILERIRSDGSYEVEHKGDVREFETEKEADDYVSSLKDKTVTVQSLPITDNLAETALQGFPMFRNIKAPTEPTFAGEFVEFTEKRKDFVKSVQEIADEYSDQLNSKVNVIKNENGLPENVITHMRKKGFTEGTVSGAYNPDTGEVFIMTDYLDDTNEAKATILHELVGHKGLRGLLGSEYSEILDDIYKSMPQEDIDRLSKLYGTKNKRVIADEYLAEQAEKDNKPTFIQKAISEIRALIRKIFGIKYSDKDIDALLVKSREYLARNRDKAAKGKPKFKASAEKVLNEEIKAKEKELSDAKKAKEKKIATFNDRMGLFGDTQNVGDVLFGDQADFSQKNLDKFVEAENNQIKRLEEEITKLKANKATKAKEAEGQKTLFKKKPTRIEKAEEKLVTKIETTDKKKETHFNHTLIKSKIKALKQGHKLGSLDTRDKLDAIQKEIIKFAKKNMPFDKARKSDINNLLVLINKTKDPTELDEVFDKISEIGLGIKKRSIIPQIDKILKKTVAKKVNNKPVGKIDPDVQLVVDQIRAIRKLDGEGFDEYLDNIDDEDTEGIGLAAMFGNLEDKTTEELEEAHQHVTEIVDEGKIWYKEKLEERKERLKEVRFKTIGKITGGKGIVSAQEYEGGVPTQKGVVDDFINQNQSFEWLLDKLSKDKKEETAQGYMQQYFGDIVHKATNAESKGIYDMTKLVHDKAAEIYGKDKKKLARILAKNSIKHKDSGVTFKTKSGKRSEVELSQNEAYKRWMEWQDPTLAATFEEMGWDDQSREELDNFMTPQVKQWAEWQLEQFYPMYHKDVNKAFREAYFANLPFNPNYSPIRREVTAVADKDDSLLKSAPMLSGVGNASLKSRVLNLNHLQLQDGDRVLMNHINEMEHFKAWAQPMAELRSIFGSRSVQHAIKYEHGNGIRGLINKHINDFASGGNDRSDVVDSVDKIRRAFVTAELGLNYTLLPKQLVSGLTYMSEMPIQNYLEGMMNLALNMRTAVNTIRGSETVKERYRKGWTHEIKAALNSNVSTNLSGARSTFNDIRNVLMLPTKAGDFGGIMAGWTVYHYYYKKQKTLGKTDSEAHIFALNKFERAISRSQQSSRLVDTGELQKGSWGKLFTMFKNSQQQYFRYESAAIRNLLKGRGSKAKNIKTIALYHVLLPVTFQAIANAFSDDDKEIERKRLLRAGIMGSFNGILIASDIIEFILEKAMGERWSYSASPLEGSVNNIGLGTYNITAGIKDMDREKVMKGVEQLAYGINNMTVGLPYRPTKKIVGQIKDKLEPERVLSEEAVERFKKLEKINREWRKKANKLDDPAQEEEKYDLLNDNIYIYRKDIIKDAKYDIKIEEENLDDESISEQEFNNRKADIIDNYIVKYNKHMKGLLRDYKERLDTAKRSKNKDMIKKIQSQIDKLSEI